MPARYSSGDPPEEGGTDQLDVQAAVLHRLDAVADLN